MSMPSIRGPGRGLKQRDKHPQQGGLAGAVGSQEPHGFTWPDTKRHAIDGSHDTAVTRLVVLDEIDHVDCRRALLAHVGHSSWL